MTKYERINSPIQIGSMVLRNRLVFAPMVTNLADSQGGVSDELIEFVRARARGGAGLVITENTAVNQAGRLFPNTRIDGDEFISGLTRLFDAVHKEGAKVIIQLDHEGRETTPDATKGLGPVAPSSIPSPVFKFTPRAMTRDDIHCTQNDFVAAALRAQKAGADGVELQGAHGFLIHQFLSPRTNKRRDNYGGDMFGRSRFVIEVIEKIKKTTGKDFVVCCRINCQDFVEGGLVLEETVQIAKLMEEAGVDVIHVSAGVLDALDHIAPTGSFPNAPHAEMIAEIYAAVGIPVIAVGKVPNLDVAEQLLAEGKAELVAFGRPLLADPDLINKEFAGHAETVVRCVWCNECLTKILSPEPKVACKLHKKQGGK